MAREAVEMCLRVLKQSNKGRFDSYSRQEQCIDHIPYYLVACTFVCKFRRYVWQNISQSQLAFLL